MKGRNVGRKDNCRKGGRKERKEGRVVDKGKLRMSRKDRKEGGRKKGRKEGHRKGRWH